MNNIAMYRDVLAIHPYGKYILVGVGNMLKIFDVNTMRYISTEKIFTEDIIHGFVRKKDKLIVYGGRSLSIVEIISTDDTLKINKLLDHIFNERIITAEFFSDDNNVCLLFAHNYAYCFNLMSKNFKIITCQEKCILYGGCLTRGNSSGLVVFSGTVFSEILVWKITNNDSTDIPVLHRLRGHKGVIFSIAYDDNLKLISSTSDDRTVRLWKITINPEDEENSNWEKYEITLKTTMFGHTARVWKSIIVNKHVISIGEDSTVCTWALDGELKNKIFAHGGSTIWSVAVSESKIFTGGADGALNIWPFNTTDLMKFHPLVYKSKKAPKFVGYLSSGILFVFFDGGEIYFYKLGHDDPFENVTLSDCEGHCILEVSPNRDYIAFASKNGYLRIFKEDVSGKLDICKVIAEITLQSKIFSLQWLSNEMLLACEAKGVLKIIKFKDGIVEIFGKFQLPTSREPWTTAATIIQNLLICGDRAGTLFVFDIDGENPRQIFQKVHERYGIQSFDVVGENLISTGRDGIMKYFKIFQDSLDSIKLLYSKKIPIEWCSKIIKVGEDRYILGFQEIEFMLYSIRLSRVILRFDCGGGHRSWDCNIKDGIVNFACIRDKLVHRLENTSCLSSGSLIDGYHTKEINSMQLFATFQENKVFISGSEDCTIRMTTLQGNEDKGFKLISLGTYDGHISNVISIATLEVKQTPLTYLVFSGGGRAQLKVWQVIIKRERKEFCMDDYEMAELTTFMLQGTDKYRRKIIPSQKQIFSVNPETRFMDIRSHLFPNIPNLAIIFIGCSDGFVRIFVYNIKANTITLITQISYNNRCILKIHTFIHENEFILITMATDGKINFWPINPILDEISRQEGNICFFENSVKEPFSCLEGHQSGINSYDIIKHPEGSYSFYSGGDDNKLNLYMFKVVVAAPNKLKLENVMRSFTSGIHQAQITGVKFIGFYHMLSVSIDQRFFMSHYKISNGTLEFLPLRNSTIFVPDVKGLVVCKSNEKSDNILATAYGRGVEVIFCNYY